MKCVICQKAKGKRGCKIQSGRSVCPPCCAAIRQEACAGCGHFAVSRAYERQRQARCRPFVCEVLPDVDDRCDEALALLERGETAQAEVALANLRHRHPNYHTVLYADGVLLGKKGKIDEAIACFGSAEGGCENVKREFEYTLLNRLVGSRGDLDRHARPSQPAVPHL